MTVITLSVTACKDAKVITPDPVRTYGASVTVKLGDSSPLQSGFYRVQLLRADGSADERFSEIRELDYVDGEQTFVIAVDASAFADANAIQTRLYVEAYVGDVAKSDAVGSRSITLVNGEDTETTLSLISAPAPVNNQTVEPEYLTDGTWREKPANEGTSRVYHLQKALRLRAFLITSGDSSGGTVRCVLPSWCAQCRCWRGKYLQRHGSEH